MKAGTVNSVIFWFVLIAYMSSIVLVVKHKLQPHVYPSPNSKFNLNRTLKNAKHLSEKIGNRILGSVQEKITNEWILQELKKIKPRLEKFGNVKIETQLVSGDYHWDLPFIENSPFVYTNITNIFIHVEPKNTKFQDEIFLVASHFDSSLTSPGFWDDGVPTAIMLEILENISETDAEITHPVIFLFGTAEGKKNTHSIHKLEYGLLGSKAFVDHHPIAKKCKAFINLEAAGGKGRNLLFQATNSWIMKEYSKSVLNFKGNSVLQDIFQSGHIPADTDYKSFSNVGMVGIDTAFYENGQFYHTKADDSGTVDERSIQHMGQSTELFVKHMITLNENYQTKDTNSDDSISSPLYFDFLSYKLFVFNFEQVKLVYWTVYLIGVMLVIQQFYYMGIKSYMKYAVIQIISFISTFIIANLVALVLTYTKNTMSWYTIGSRFGSLLYVFPSILGLLLPFYFIKFQQGEKIENLYIPILVFWTKILLLGIYIQKNGLAGFSLIHVVALILLITFKNSIFFYFIMIVPTIYLIEFEFMTLEFISAISGRAFTKYTEFVFAVLVAFFTFLIGVLFTPFFVKHSKITKRSLLTICLISVIFIGATTLLFPYGNKSPKRIISQHLIQYDSKMEESSDGIVKPLDSFISVRSTDSSELSTIPNWKSPDRIEKKTLLFIPTLGPPDSYIFDASVYNTQYDQSILKYSRVYAKENKKSIIPFIELKEENGKKKMNIISSQYTVVRLLNFDTKCQVIRWSLDEKIYEKFNGTHFSYTIRQTNGFHDFENGKKFTLEVEQESTCQNEEKLIYFEVSSFYLSSDFDIESSNEIEKNLPDWVSLANVIITTVNKVI